MSLEDIFPVHRKFLKKKKKEFSGQLEQSQISQKMEKSSKTVNTAFQQALKTPNQFEKPINCMVFTLAVINTHFSFWKHLQTACTVTETGNASCII